MGYITCKKCGCEMSDKSEACPVCGATVGESLASETEQIQKTETVRQEILCENKCSKLKIGPIIGGIAVVIIAVAVILLLIITNDKQTPENTAPVICCDTVSSISEIETGIPNESTNKAVGNDIPENFTYERYNNDLFGFELDYPSFFEMDAASESSDGCVFTYGDCEIISYGSYNVHDCTIGEILDKSKECTVTYSVVKDDWGVVSGIDDDGRIYYIKQFLVEDVVYTLVLRYPQDQKSAFDSILKHVTKSYSYTSGYD